MIKALSCFGLGKLGLPLAALFARSGLSTLGIDKDNKGHLGIGLRKLVIGVAA